MTSSYVWCLQSLSADQVKGTQYGPHGRTSCSLEKNVFNFMNKVKIQTVKHIKLQYELMSALYISSN